MPPKSTFLTFTNTPFLEEMSLASSSLRLARESASSSARGRAFSWGAERLCRRWRSPKVWVSASRRAAQNRQEKHESGTKTHCDGEKRVATFTFRESRDGALALV